MKLTIAITDKRSKPSHLGYYDIHTSPESEDYDRITITDAEASAAVLASILRGIADDIDPAPVPWSPPRSGSGGSRPIEVTYTGSVDCPRETLEDVIKRMARMGGGAR